jgi:outer membrane lipoprotein
LEDKFLNLKIGLGGAGLLIMLLLTGCTSGLSKQARTQVTIKIGFSELISNPDKYIGETVLLGGEIIETRPAKNRSEIMVLQLPLDSEAQPMPKSRSKGRFLIQSDQFLDPEIYKKGRRLSLVGRIIGKEIRPIGNFDYTYPLFEPIEMKVWSQQTVSGPLFHFGLGLGTSF